ncbi:niemann-Pick type C- protein 1 [Mitosporidium daphniae]
MRSHVFILLLLFAIALREIESLSSLFEEKVNGPGPGICSMYDVCDPGRRLNCAGYKKAPILSDAKTLASIKEWCGIDIVNDHKGHSCVSPSQWSVIEAGLKFARPLLSPCPACWKNFISLWCEMSVSPHQSLYVRVIETSKASGRWGKPVATALNYYVTPTLRQGLFDSCANVSMGMTNKKILDVMFSAEASRNPDVLFEMLGKNSTMRSPFLIRFPHFEADSLEEEMLQTYTGSTSPSLTMKGNQAWSTPVPADVWPLNTTMFPCDDPVYGCVCVDCHRKCPAPANWVTWAPAPCTLSLPLIGRSGCWTFAVSIVYFFAIIVLSIILAVKLFFLARQNYEEDLERNHAHQSAQGGDPSSCRLYKYGVEDLIAKKFYAQGKWVTMHIPQVLLTASAFVIISILVLIATKGLQIERDPVKLWVGPHSQSALQKQFYDEKFGAFFRVAQVIIRPKVDINGAVTREAITLIFDLIEELRHMKVLQNITTDGNIDMDIKAFKNGVSLEDICYKPLGRECLIQSVALIWPTREAFEATGDAWAFDFDTCMRSPTDCLGFDGNDQNLRVPLMPELVVGGIPLKYKKLPAGAGGRPAPLPIDPESWIEAKSLVITLLLDPKDENQHAACIEWERAFIETLRRFEKMHTDFTWAFSAESSVEWEINRETEANAPVILISYLAMFVYVALALGRHSRRKRKQNTSEQKKEESSSSSSSPWFSGWPSLVDMRCTLALGGVLLVAVSILFSAAIFTLLQIKTTLIIAEVIPFLVLAVGVDNLFLLVQAYESTGTVEPAEISKSSTCSFMEDKKDPAIDAKMESTLNNVAPLLSGPSILVTELAELLAFLIGCNVEMPAVASFSMYAVLAIAFDICLQMTVFTVFLTLDGRRIAAGRPDPIAGALSRAFKAVWTWLCPILIRLKTRFSTLWASDTMSSDLSPQIAKDTQEIESTQAVKSIRWPFVLLFFSLLGIGRIRLGLEQRLAVPSDSYLVPYFDALETELLVGPPLFFVLRNADVAGSTSIQRSIATRFYQDIMDELSIGSIVEVNKGEPGSYLSSGISNWFDDFLAWSRHCCRIDPVTGDRSSSPSAVPCISEQKRTLTQLALNSETIGRFLPWFLEEMPSAQCPFAGGAAYANQVRLKGSVSAFKAYLQPLRSQEDFIASLRASRRIAGMLTTAIQKAAKVTANGVPPEMDSGSLPEIFAFSPYFVFFDQYLEIIWISILLCTLCLLVILVVTWALLGSFEAALFSALSVCSTAVSLFGVMGWWSIGLSAVSLVNVIIAMGISVEFSSNMIRAYMVVLDAEETEESAYSGFEKEPSSCLHGASFNALPSRKKRVELMVAETGTSVFFGITLTKLIGISILYWSTSKLFEVFYFRMYIATVALAAFHGLALLPVVLARWGPHSALSPPSYK